MTTRVTFERPYQGQFTTQQSETQNSCHKVFELISKERCRIKVPASFFQGHAMWPRMELVAIDGRSFTILVEEYSEGTVRAFAEYIQLGYNNFLKKYGQPGDEYQMSSCTIPVFALLDFAHKYGQTRLFECCAEIIHSAATKEDADRVCEAHQKYQSDYLWKIYQDLTTESKEQGPFSGSSTSCSCSEPEDFFISRARGK
jgi:hypothetical protein